MRVFLSTMTGVAIWLGAWLVLLPSPFDATWARFILLLAALVLVPLAIRLFPSPSGPRLRRLWQAVRLLQLPAAILLACSFLPPQGAWAATLAMPWLATTTALAVIGLARLLRRGIGPIDELCLDAALIFIAVGGGWAILDRFGARPLEFEPIIVLLTGIHFHYAGFVLPLTAGLAIRQVSGRFSAATGWAVLAGVPLVAAGITATQLGGPPWLECLAAWLLALAAISTGWLLLRLALRPGPKLVRCLWAVSAASLIAAMVLAAVYGSRAFLSVDWLDIPWMRALHGTANALGFATAGLLAWNFKEQDGLPIRTN